MENKINHFSAMLRNIFVMTLQITMQREIGLNDENDTEGHPTLGIVGFTSLISSRHSNPFCRRKNKTGTLAVWSGLGVI